MPSPSRSHSIRPSARYETQLYEHLLEIASRLEQRPFDPRLRQQLEELRLELETTRKPVQHERRRAERRSPMPPPLAA